MIRYPYPLNRKGFLVYLALMVTTILFFLVTGSQDVARFSMDMGRSTALETVGFHAADGGLERGLARLRKSFSEFGFTYSSGLGHGRKVLVSVKSEKSGDSMVLKSTATVSDGDRIVAVRNLERRGVLKLSGRSGCGRFVEVPPTVGQIPPKRLDGAVFGGAS